MNHKSSYEPVSGFALKAWIRVRLRVWIRVRVGFSVRVRVRFTGVFFLRLNILTHDSLTHDSLKLQFPI